MNLYTIGFTQKSAQQFFELLKKNKVKRLIDTRLNNRSQLSGFAKQDDLKYFLSEITGIEYIYKPDYAPTDDILKGYKNKQINWNEYSKRYLELLEQRNISKTTETKILEDSCLLCSEHRPEHCHRSLLAEYLSEHLGNINIIHLT
ncbi:MAG: DUF488 domain-containing protein [Candidatus Omnitrophica bacterium]|nr:DUF488 domain-containing protein [Candidatus Omnitrophota bacterium]